MFFSLTFTSSLLICLLLFSVMAYFFRKEMAEYAVFKAQTDTFQRQAFYKKWTIRSFLLYGGVTAILLLASERWSAIATLPAEFSVVSISLQSGIAADNNVFDKSFLSILAVVFVVSSLVSPTLIAYLTRGKAEKRTVGDIQSLIPRNRSEKFCCVFVSINAGISEELFFRLMQPLLLFYVFGNVFIAFVLSAALFGIVHFYQGWAGVVFTFIFGVVLTLIYLGTGHLWVVMLVHAAMNLNGLIIQPFLTSRV